MSNICFEFDIWTIQITNITVNILNDRVHKLLYRDLLFSPELMILTSKSISNNNLCYFAHNLVCISDERRSDCVVLSQSTVLSKI